MGTHEMNIISGKGTDHDLRKAATIWLGMWTALQERFNDNPAYELDDTERKSVRITIKRG